MISVMTSFSIKAVSKKHSTKKLQEAFGRIYMAASEKRHVTHKKKVVIVGDSVIGRCECIHFLNHPGPPEESTEKV